MTKQTKVKLTRQTVTLTLEQEQSTEVNAWVYDNLLAWHKSITGQWVLTHLSTGYKITDFCGKYANIRPMTEKIAMLDWNVKDHKILKVLSLETKAIISQYIGD